MYIWQSELDGVYDCVVERKTGYTGLLKIIDKRNSEVLHEREVGLSYGAQWGPDIGDVAQWQDICATFVDNIDV